MSKNDRDPKRAPHDHVKPVEAGPASLENERNRLATVFVVEATDCELQYLWLENSEDALASGYGSAEVPRVPWEQVMLGYIRTVGSFAGQPVAVSVSFARVLGFVVAFYEATGFARHFAVARGLGRLPGNCIGR